MLLGEPHGEVGGHRGLARLGKERTRATLADGQSATVGKYKISYTAQRTRTLAMVHAGIDDA